MDVGPDCGDRARCISSHENDDWPGEQATFTSRVAFEYRPVVWDQKLKPKHSAEANLIRISLTIRRCRKQF